MKMIKYLPIIFCLFVCVGKMHAASLHAIVVCDTWDERAGESLQVDFDLMLTRLNLIKNKTNLTLCLQSFTGKRATPKNVLKAIGKLKVKKDDVIFFYFAGHGFHLEKKGDGLPYLAFSVTKEACDFYALTQQLINKEPRMLISLSDYCNSNIPKKFAPKIVKRPLIPKDRFATLFTKGKGILIGTGAKQGEFAYYSEDGSFFTLGFLDALENELVECPDANWDGVASRLCNQVQNETLYIQCPYCLFFDQKPTKNFKLKDYKI